MPRLHRWAETRVEITWEPEGARWGKRSFTRGYLFALERQAGRPQAGVMTSYVVQPGDTLSGIAERFGVSLSDLKKANPQIKNPDLIHPGEIVYIPARHRTYVVQPGDTLSGIAERFGVSLSDLKKANPQIKNPDLIHPGEIVTIP